MPGDTAIGWTHIKLPNGATYRGRSWNPTTGCTKVSPGCDHCYAEALSERFRGGKGFPNGFDLTLRPDRLTVPLGWKEPSGIFVNSMSDLFHEDVPDDFIRDVFKVMYQAHWHIFQVLTKRAPRMAALVNSKTLALGPNVWLGVSCESRAQIGRLNHLRNLPVAVRFVSFEPLIGPVVRAESFSDYPLLSGIDWAITGGESGPHHRPFNPQWAIDIGKICIEEGVSWYHKQHGGLTPRSGGRVLNGVIYDGFPTPKEDRLDDYPLPVGPAFALRELSHA